MGALSGTRIAIIGLGVSGRAAARLALHHGGEVYVSDVRDDPATRAGGRELEGMGASVEMGGHDLERVLGADEVVASPGIAPEAPVLAALTNAGRRWISEPELAFRFFQSPLIAVTGTNGKTTTAAWTAHVLGSAGVRVGLGGNIGGGLGPPASDLALLDPPPDWLVVELSSYQLGAVSRLRPDIGVLTSLAPDHLDRYGSVEDYYADKARLFANATPASRWILERTVPDRLPLDEDVPGDRYLFGLERPTAAGSGARGGAWIDGTTVRVDVGEGGEPVADTRDLPMPGAAGVANAMAASLAARLAGVPARDVARALPTFQPLPHRLEPVGERAGVLWVDDSKATNVAAAAGAVASFDRPLVVLLGGVDKGEDLSPLAEALSGRARTVIVYGAARQRFHDALARVAPTVRVDGDFDEAVSVASGVAVSGDVLLLSPACASFDEFENYMARGRRFAEHARGDG